MVAGFYTLASRPSNQSCFRGRYVHVTRATPGHSVALRVDLVAGLDEEAASHHAAPGSRDADILQLWGEAYDRAQAHPPSSPTPVAAAAAAAAPLAERRKTHERKRKRSMRDRAL